MLAERLEVRLDPERRRKLSAIAAEKGVPIAEVIREMIDHAYNESARVDAWLSALQLGKIQLEDAPDPATLSRQLDATHDLADLY